MKKNLVIVLAVIMVIAAGFLYWYHFNFASKTLIKLTVPVATHTSMTEFIANVIKKEGIDKKHGLDITFDYLAPGDIEQRYFSGDYTMATFGPLTAASAYERGVPSVIIGPMTDMTYEIAVPVNSPIKTLADLSGKKFAVLPKATAAYQSVAVVLASAGIRPDKDLQLVFGTVPQILGYLQSGEADAAIVSYPSAAALYASGKYRSIGNLEQIWEANENGLPFPFVVTVARKDWYENNKSVAKAYMDTWFEGVAAYKNNPSILAQYPDYLAANHASSSAAIALIEKNTPALLPSSWDTVQVTGIERFAQVAMNVGIFGGTSATIDAALIKPDQLGN